MERYWVPSSAKSAVFGTDLMDYWFPVSQGGDIAFLYGVLKVLVANNWLNHEFIRDHTVDFDKLKQHVNELAFDSLEKQSGLARSGHAGVRRTHSRREERRARLEHGHHATRFWRRRRLDDSSTSASRAATSVVTRTASCPSAAIPACREAPRWAPTRPRCRAASPSRPKTSMPLSKAYGFPIPTKPGLTDHGNGRGLRAR
jgi:hypothetical protein